MTLPKPSSSNLKLLIVGLFLLTALSIQAQVESSIIPPSPVLTEFTKFGDFPVGYNTGIPDIAIPLYTIKSGSVEVPIVLRYHSNGVKPNNEDHGWIANGWTLDVGGVVSRTIMARPDELNQKRHPFLGRLDIMPEDYTDHYYYLYSLAGSHPGRLDAEYDQFSYSFLGNHGKFVIEDQRDGQFLAYNYPYKPYQISVKTVPDNYGETNFYRRISGIDITDDFGKVFEFGYENREYPTLTGSNPSPWDAPTGWFLEKIISDTKTDSVMFLYDNPAQFYPLQGSMRRFVVSGEAGVFIGSEDGGPPTYDTQPNSAVIDQCEAAFSFKSYNSKIIKSIIFGSGSVQFFLNSNKRQIDSLIVYGQGNEVIKRIAFNRLTENIRQLLLSVNIKSANETDKQSYTFTYHDGLNVPTGSYKSEDSWGFSNGYRPVTFGGEGDCKIRNIKVSYGEDQLPTHRRVETKQVGSATFNVDSSEGYRFLKHHMLKEIRYPTGGTTTFDYEPNVYKEGNQLYIGGGLRIKRILSSGGDSPSERHFHYQPGFIEHSLNNESNFITNFGTVEVLAVHPFSLSKHYYHRLTTIYSNGWNANLGDNNVFYTHVSELFGTPEQNEGKIAYQYSYDNPNDYHVFAYPNTGVASTYTWRYKNWGNGLLKNKTIYKREGETFSKVKSIGSTYEFRYGKIFKNLAVSTISHFPIPDLRRDLRYGGRNWQYWNPYPFKFYEYEIITGSYHLVSETDTVFNGDNNHAVERKEYVYDTLQHYYPTKTIIYNSKGIKTEREMKYVLDFETIAPYISMKGLNIVVPLVEVTDWKYEGSHRKLINKQTNSYAQFFPNVIKPAVVEMSSGEESFVTNSYLSYDVYGNPREIKDVNGPITVYLWGYKGQYPVTKIENATYAEVASVLGTTFINSLNSGNVTDADIRQKMGVLRSHTSMRKAQVTSYTYKPLVGMTSMTDPRGSTEYYEYDSFGRLSVVKDFEGNILKTYCYNYAGQQVDCF